MRFLKMRIWTCLLTAAVLLAGTLSLAGFGTAMASGTNGYTYVWQNPVGYGEQVFSTSALSNNAVWSVGAYGCIEYWNGTTVTKQASGTTNHLYGVSAYDATHVWAVGEARTILFYNGTSWAAQAAPSLGYSYDLYAVSAGANNRVWAVGGYDGFKNAVILYYNGTSWTATGNQALTLATGGFTDVWAYSATAVWAVGGVNGWTYFYNGSTWTKVNDGSAHAPYQVSAYSATAVWAVDWDGTMLYSTNAGTTWNAAPAPPNTGTAYGTKWPSSVSALDATHIYAVGWGGSIAMYNGTSWATQGSGTTNDLNDVDAYTSSYIYTAGDAKFMRYSTPTWTTLTGGTTSNLYQVWGYDANNLLAVGSNDTTFGNIQSTTSGGNIWSTQSSGTTSTLYGVANVDKTHVWVAGPGVLFWNGSTWSTQLSSSQTYYSICAAGANAVYVGAGNGQVSYYNGSTWTAQNTGVSSGIWAISAPDATHAWACSNTGTIIYTSNSGTTWSKQTTNTSTNIDWVTALNSTTAWAFGDGGLILYTNNAGATWTPQTSGTTQNLYGGFALDGTHVWAVGTGGTILFYNGTSWAAQTSPTTNTLWAVYAKDANDAWIVGDAGTILFADPPFIKTCSPTYCAPGKTMDVEVIGGYTNFQASTPTLSFGSGVSVVPGSMNVVDNTHIYATVKVAADAALGPRDVNAITAGETPIPLSGGFVVGTEPKPASTACYLAEGSTAWGFQTRIAVMNPNDTAVTIRPTFMTKDGPLVKPNITLPARSTRVIDPMADYNLITDFSTRIECLEGKTIAVDRTMSWLGKGATAPEGHSSVGVSAPASTWYLAEGSSAWGFECWTLIQNPNAKPAKCKITYMRDGATPVTVTKTVPANSRSTFNMADDIGSADASIKISADVPVIAERSMYRNNRREGSNSIGTTAPSQDYYLAEGSTAWGFTTYVLVQNPNSIPTDVTVTYNTASGPVQGKPLTIPARARATIKVNDTAPNMDLSTHVHGTQPIIAERAMYWDTSTGQACHDSIGMSSPHRVFYLPGGQSGYGFERWFTTWTLIQNPNNADVQVKVSYLTYNGSKNATLRKTVPANSRISINMADKITDATAGVVVECTTAGRKIMVERSTYWDTQPGGSSAGVNTIGASSD